MNSRYALRFYLQTIFIANKSQISRDFHVTIDNGGSKRWSMQLQSKNTKPEEFSINTNEVPKQFILFEEWVRMPMKERRHNYNNVSQNYLDAELPKSPPKRKRN